MPATCSGIVKATMVSNIGTSIRWPRPVFILWIKAAITAWTSAWPTALSAITLATSCAVP